MARGRGYNYYRGQYDPSEMYQNVQPSGVISMYNPEAQSQLIGAVAKRQERFDIAKMAQAQEMARIGETETYDLPELTKRLQSFESGINSIVKDKYNGDYSAAANEIATMIGTERSNPFYHFNKQKVEMGKAYLDAKMKIGPGFMSAGNPFEVSFQDWQSGKTLEFTPIDSKDLTARSAALFANFSKKLMSDSGLVNSPEGQYFKSIRQYGFKDAEEAWDYAEKHGLIDELFASMPELAGVENQQAVKEAFREGAVYGIGQTEVQYLQNRGFDETGGQSPFGGGIVSPGGNVNIPFDYDDIMKSEAFFGIRDQFLKDEASKLGIKVDSYEDFKKMKGPEYRELKRALKTRVLAETTDANMPSYDFNPGTMIGIKGGATLFNDTKKLLTSMLNGKIASADVVGKDKKTNKLIEDISEIEDVISYTPVPSRNIYSPLYLYFDVMAVPKSRGNGKKLAPTRMTIAVAPDSYLDNWQFYNAIDRLHPRLGHTLAYIYEKAIDSMPSDIDENTKKYISDTYQYIISPNGLNTAAELSKE